MKPAFRVSKIGSTMEFVWDNNKSLSSTCWHRANGPAYKFKNIIQTVISYYHNDKLHRYDGPAHINWSRIKRHRVGELWSIHGSRIEKNDYLNWLHQCDMDINNLTDEDKMLIDLKWGEK